MKPSLSFFNTQHPFMILLYVYCKAHRNIKRHLGESSCLKRAWECLYWPNMNSGVKNYIQSCNVCRAMGTRQQEEPLQQPEVPDRPWAKVRADLFVIDSRNYQVITDYYFNFIEVDSLKTTTLLLWYTKWKPNLPNMEFQREWWRIMAHSLHPTNLPSLGLSGNAHYNVCAAPKRQHAPKRWMIISYL